MKNIFLLFIMIISTGVTTAIAQPRQSDTLQNDSANIYQLEITQNYQQQAIDSIVKARIKKELDTASSEKTRELEEELRQIAIKDSLRKTEQLKKIDALKKTSTGYPVAPFGDTIFDINLRLGSFKAKERAEQITKRIEEIYKDNFFKADSLIVLPNDIGSEIDYKNGYTVMTVSDLDALWFNKGGQQLAEEYRDKIKQAILAEKARNSLVNWLKRIAFVLLIIAGAVLLVYLVNRLYHFTRSLLTRNRSKYFKGISAGKLKLFTPDYEERFVVRLLSFLRVVIIILSVYLCLPLLFYVFPETQDITTTLLDWIITPAKNIVSGIIDFLPHLFTIIIIYVFTSYVIKGIRYFAIEVETGRMHIPGFHPDFAKPTFNILRFILYAFMLVIIFPYLPGSGSPAFQGVSVFLGILLSLGSSSAITNIIAGLVITYMRPFKIGDRVKIGDTVGDVIEKSMLVIKLRTIKNEEITVPNSMILSSNTINYSANDKTTGLIIHSTVTIGYSVPWKNMHEALIKAALQTKNILKEPVPFVLQTALNDFYVSYEINAYTRESNKQVDVYSELHQNIQDCCNEAGIEIMSPHYTNLRDGNMTTIPENYLHKDYEVPPFNIRQDANSMNKKKHE